MKAKSIGQVLVGSVLLQRLLGHGEGQPLLMARLNLKIRKKKTKKYIIISMNISSKTLWKFVSYCIYFI